MALLAGMVEIFGLDRQWDKVKHDMTDARIREFYEFVARLWPVDTDPRVALPPPDSTLRALYLGENEPELMLENVFRFCLYADQIVLVNPFDNPNLMAEEFNPVYHPGEWRVQTLRLVYHLALLGPWIEAGLVLLIPDPGDFNRELRVNTWNLAMKRFENRVPSEEVESSAVARRSRSSLLLAPTRYWEAKMRQVYPEASEGEVKKFLEYIERERANDPLLPAGTLDKMPGQMMAMRMGANLEMGLYICQAIGAFPYTNVPFRWREILSARDKLDSTSEIWSPLTHAFQQLKFKFLDKVNSKFAYEIRDQGRLEGFRAYLRKLWNEVGGGPDASKSEGLARDFRDRLSQAYQEAQADWEAIDRELIKWAIATVGGAIAVGIFSPAFSGVGFTVAGVGEIIQREMKRREFRRKVPMSVFIDLERQGPG